MPTTFINSAEHADLLVCEDPDALHRVGLAFERPQLNHGGGHVLRRGARRRASRAHAWGSASALSLQWRLLGGGGAVPASRR